MRVRKSVLNFRIIDVILGKAKLWITDSGPRFVPGNNLYPEIFYQLKANST